MALSHFVRQQIEKELKNVDALSFTYDGWTNQHRHRFVVITIHYMLPSGVCRDRVFDLVLFRQTHTTQNLTALLKEKLRDALPHNIFIHAGVGDNASNSSNTISDFKGGNFIPCFSHTLQLVIGDAIKSSGWTEIVLNIHDIVAYIRN
jgi:hypothetical protein